MAQAYCFKCRKKVEIKNPQKVALKNGKTCHSWHLSEVRHQSI